MKHPVKIRLYVKYQGFGVIQCVAIRLAHFRRAQSCEIFYANAKKAA